MIWTWLLLIGFCLAEADKNMEGSIYLVRTFHEANHVIRNWPKCKFIVNNIEVLVVHKGHHVPHRTTSPVSIPLYGLRMVLTATTSLILGTSPMPAPMPRPVTIKSAIPTATRTTECVSKWLTLWGMDQVSFNYLYDRSPAISKNVISVQNHTIFFGPVLEFMSILGEPRTLYQALA